MHSTGPKPASDSSARATCSPQPVPSPAPPSKDTVMQCSRLMAYVIGATGLAMLSFEVAGDARLVHQEGASRSRSTERI